MYTLHFYSVMYQLRLNKVGIVGAEGIGKYGQAHMFEIQVIRNEHLLHSGQESPYSTSSG